MPKAEPNKMLYLGIDPGANGALAFRTALFNNNGFIKFQEDPKALHQSMLDMFAGAQCVAVIEKVGGYIGIPQTGSSMFNFGYNVGLWTMSLAAMGIRYEAITPAVWQKGLKIPKREKSESNTDWKNRLKARASQLFPEVKMTLQIADAYLIAEFCFRKTEGRL